MNSDRAERSKKFIAIAAEHAEDFKTRVAQHDRENSFPHENVAAMKASGYTNMVAPAELGGGGADILDEVLAQERLARGDLPTAISINMHLFAVGWLSDRWRVAGQREGRLRSFLEAIVRDRLILGAGLSDPTINSMLGFGGILDTSRHAKKVAGGYLSQWHRQIQHDVRRGGFPIRDRSLRGSSERSRDSHLLPPDQDAGHKRPEQLGHDEYQGVFEPGCHLGRCLRPGGTRQ
jgi:hypothetical protein